MLNGGPLNMYFKFNITSFNLRGPVKSFQFINIIKVYITMNLADFFNPRNYQLFSKIKVENVHIFWAGRISQLMTSHTQTAHYVLDN